MFRPPCSFKWFNPLKVWNPWDIISRTNESATRTLFRVSLRTQTTRPSPSPAAYHACRLQTIWCFNNRPHLQPPRTFNRLKGFTRTQGVPPRTVLGFKCFAQSQHGRFTGNAFVLRVSFSSHTREPLRTQEWGPLRTTRTPLTQRTIKRPSSKIWRGLTWIM